MAATERAKLDGFTPATDGKAAKTPAIATVAGRKVTMSFELPCDLTDSAAVWQAAGAVFGTGSPGVHVRVQGGPLDGAGFNLMGPSSGIKKADRLAAENAAMRAELAALRAKPVPDADGITRVAAGPGRKTKAGR